MELQDHVLLKMDTCNFAPHDKYRTGDDELPTSHVLCKTGAYQILLLQKGF